MPSNMLDKFIKDLNGKQDYFIGRADADDAPCTIEEWLSTDCVVLDAMMGGGLPVGRIIEMYGDTSTGKSLIAAQATAAALAQDYLVLYIDSERALSLTIMEAVGVDVTQVVYADPETIEALFELMDKALASKPVEQPILIVWDSVAATTIDREQDSDVGKSVMGRHALLISQGLRKFNHKISANNAIFLVLNQTRQNIGVMFGDNETTFGGKALPFYSSIRIRLKKGKKLKDGKKIIGIETRASIVKNKVSTPFKEAILPIYFGEGIDEAEAALLWLKSTDDITVKGAWHDLELPSGVLHFQKKTWVDLFDKHYNEICDIIMEVDDDDVIGD